MNQNIRKQTLPDNWPLLTYFQVDDNFPDFFEVRQTRKHANFIEYVSTPSTQARKTHQEREYVKHANLPSTYSMQSTRARRHAI